MTFVKRIALVITLVSVGLASVSSLAQSSPSHKYDLQIRQSVNRWWPEYPEWLMWKAQLWQESRLDPTATSSVGAAGIAQFMPKTWAQMMKQLGYTNISPYTAKYAIDVGAAYMAQLRAGWTANRTEYERHRLAQASYNAGFGNILRSQSTCGGKTWDEISPCLYRITGRTHSSETLGYVRLIKKWYDKMVME